MIVHVKFSNLITFVFENTQNPNAIYMLSFEVFNPSVEAFSYALRYIFYSFQENQLKSLNTRVKVTNILSSRKE